MTITHTRVDKHMLFILGGEESPVSITVKQVYMIHKELPWKLLPWTGVEEVTDGDYTNPSILSSNQFIIMSLSANSDLKWSYNAFEPDSPNYAGMDVENYTRSGEYKTFVWDKLQEYE